MTKKRFSKKDIDKMCKEASEYIASPEGRKNIKETIRLAKEVTDKLKESRKVKHEQLHKPMTI